MTEAAAVGGKDRGGMGRVILLALCVLLLAAGVLLLFGGPTLYRMKLLDLNAARDGLPAVAMYLVAAAGIGALGGLAWAILGRKHRAGIVAVLVLIAAGVAGGRLYADNVMHADLPPINDVQTDWNQPVAYTEKALQVRQADGAVRVRDDAVVGEGEGKWTGMSYADAQAKFYDDIGPLLSPKAPPVVTLAAEEAAKRLGWDVMMSDPPGGALEAVYHSPWYDLVYDIAVRVTPHESGSRMDVRSTSRSPGPDLGENASQVRQFLNEVTLQLRN